MKTMRARCALPLVLTPLWLAACQVNLFAQSISLNPVADAFVVSSEPNNNYGGGGAFGVSAAKSPNGELQALLRFDLASAKSSFDTVLGAGNWVLDSAVLQLGATGANNSIFNPPTAGQLRVTWLENDTWIEGDGTPTSPDAIGLTWNTLPSFLSAGDEALGNFAFDGSTTATVMVNLGLSPGLVADVGSGDLASLRLDAATGDTAAAGVFHTRSFNTASRRPLLTLNAVAVPEPSGWLLAVSAACALACAAIGFRKRAGSSP